MRTPPWRSFRSSRPPDPQSAKPVVPASLHRLISPSMWAKHAVDSPLPQRRILDLSTPRRHFDSQPRQVLRGCSALLPMTIKIPALTSRMNFPQEKRVELQHLA